MDEPGDGKPAATKRMNSKKPFVVQAAQGGFYLNAGIWIVLGLFTLTRTQNPVMVLVLCLLMAANALLLVWIGWGLGRRKRMYYFLGAAVIGLNFILTLTDEVGIFDLIVLFVNGVLLVLLFAIRGEYFGSGRIRDNGD